MSFVHEDCIVIPVMGSQVACKRCGMIIYWWVGQVEFSKIQKELKEAAIKHLCPALQQIAEQVKKQ